MENIAERLRESIASIEVAMLTTINNNNEPVSRPMYTLQMDHSGILWFFTAKNSPKMDEVEANNKVNISYADSNTHTYVSITGTALCKEDTEKKVQFWNEIHEAWFPKGVNDPDLCLLRVRTKTAEIWDQETATMVSVLSNQDVAEEKHES